MSASLPLPVSLIESYGLGLIQQAMNALGANVLTLTADGSGFDAALTLSKSQKLLVDGLIVSSAGLSGRISISGLNANSTLQATLFDSFTVALTTFDITLAQGGIAASHIGGQLTLPFFDQPVDIEISTRADGNISISVSAAPTQDTTPDGLIKLVYKLPSPTGGSVEIDVASLEINEVNSVWTVIVSGNLIITAGGLSWPSIGLQGLGIDSKGNISLQGGWIDLPDQFALSFYGFSLDLQKLGFGSNANGDKWIGFNGAINLVEGLSLGASVRGLLINLSTGDFSFDEVSISFAIQDVLEIDGTIDYLGFTAETLQDLSAHGLAETLFAAIPTSANGQKTVHIFAGQVKVVIHALQGLEVDAGFIVGSFGGQSVFFLDIDVELPVGFPIFLDVGLYGLQGLVATGLDPDPEPTNTWWEWFKYKPGNTTGKSTKNPPRINTANPTDYDATDINKWLVPSPGAFAIGAGATIGTLADDGYTVSAAIMLVLLLPGPVISLIGKANILSKRVSAASQDANFDAMATYDGNAKTFDLTIDAQYQIPVVLDIQGTAELYVGGGEWFFALGKPPHEQRVKARIFDLFECDAYFVVSDVGLITGTWIGFKGSWSFGPLSASVDAYLATLAAVQWAPLQIAGGLELYGNIHLSAFGISVGLTADCLLEGCAPNPFWVHGELSVELDLPWPLPDIGATISLSWGGDDGTVPPGPLALSHLDATLADHCAATGKPSSDHYVLLAHRSTRVSTDLPVVYDPTTPGILNLQGSSLTNWQLRTAAMLPDLAPDDTSPTQLAPVLPQDAHFVLTFAHPTVDGTGAFAGAVAPAAETETPAPPPPPKQVGSDDMSNLNINPPNPSVPFLIQHTLTEIDLYVCANPLPPASQNPWTLIWSSTAPSAAVRGVWLEPAQGKANPKPMTQLKLVPSLLLPGGTATVQWGATSQISPATTAFTDQGLSFASAQGIDVAKIGNGGVAGAAAGLLFASDGTQTGLIVTIIFPLPCTITGVTGLVYAGEGAPIAAPQVFAGGALLVPQSSTQDRATLAWTSTYPQNGEPVQTFTIPVSGSGLLLYSIDSVAAPVPAAILPWAPALYALKTVTTIAAKRAGAAEFAPVDNGSPIVEFSYFQTAAGPGTAGGPGAPATTPQQPPPFPQLANNAAASPSATELQPPSRFPTAGGLMDLTTYTQWSWPLDGATAAYFGYDVNVEFCETYVHLLYRAFAYGTRHLPWLHFRCTDRNGNHTLLAPSIIGSVPSIPQQSAVAAGAVVPQLPACVVGIEQPIRGLTELTTLLQSRAGRLPPTRAPLASSSSRSVASLPATLRSLGLDTQASALAVQRLGPGVAAGLLHQIQEYQDALAAQQLWFRPLQPRTRYTLDVVPGPLEPNQDLSAPFPAGMATYAAIMAATDPISLLNALNAYFDWEASLVTLKRVQFTTSRYPTFSAHMANAVAQPGALPGTAPVRNYSSAQDPFDWLSASPNLVNRYDGVLNQYLTYRGKLADVIVDFDPLADSLQATGSAAVNGPAALVDLRKAVAKDWEALNDASGALFDGLIAALGLPDLATGKKPVAVPDTEISLITDNSKQWVTAILLQSPEPLPWQRIWRWIWTSNPGGLPLPMLVVWRADGSSGLLIPVEEIRGSRTVTITFQGNVGAEAPCITQGGLGVVETVALGPIEMGPPLLRVPVGGAGVGRPVFNPPPALKELLGL